MFKLRFSPDFARQKRALLAQSSIPHLDFPASVERCLAFMISDPDAVELGALRTPRQGRIWWACLRAMRPLLFKAAAISFLASGCAALASLVGMLILQEGQGLGRLIFLSLVFFGMNSFTQGANYQSGRLRAWVGLGTESYLAGLISRKLLNLSAVSAARQSTGNLKILITSDVRNIGQFMDNMVRNLIPGVTALLVIAPLLIRFSGRAGLMGILTMAAILPVSLVLNRVSVYFQAKSQAGLDALTARMGEWVKNVRLIRGLSWEESFRSDVSMLLGRFMRFAIAQHFMACLIFGLSMSWWMVSITGTAVSARLLGLHLDLLSFFGSLWLLTILSGYFVHLPNTIRLYGEATISMQRIARLLAEPELSDLFKPTPPGWVKVAPLGRPRRLHFEEVGFRHENGKQAVRSFSYVVDLRRKLAVIGAVGSGKSTLLKLLCGEFPPTEGKIQVEFEDGARRDLWEGPTHAAFRECLAYVPQEAFVSSDTLSMNLSLGREVDEAQALEAAYWAELEADIAEFPRGLGEEIGESGVNLSGGQKQRLNLARARFAGRDFFVLDDTLSAVDTRTEMALMDRLIGFEGGFILVTHRTGELMRVEQVIVLKDGGIIEKGDPHTLIQDRSSQFVKVLRAYQEPEHG
jgi:ABC-type multidrug transport system fused ATPase/permease subunit